MQSIPFRSSELKPGQVLGRDVWEDRSRAVVLRAGYRLDEPAIEGLVKRGVRCVFIATGPIEKTEPTPEQSAVEVSARAIPEIGEVCEQLFSTYESSALAGETKKQMGSVRRKMLRAVSGVIKEIRERGVEVAVLLGAGQGENDRYLHSATVAYLSVLTALRIHPGNEDVARSVALGALFHDAALAGEKPAAVEDHPEAGYRIMKEMGFKNAVAGAVVRDHHRNIDGTGYPQVHDKNGGLKREIHDLAGVVRLAAAYSEAIEQRGLLSVEALHDLKSMNERFRRKLYDRKRLADYLMKLSESEDAEERRLCGELTKKLRFAKEDFDRHVIKPAEYRRQIFNILPAEYMAGLKIGSKRFGERVLVPSTALRAFLRVAPPFGLLDEVEISSGETGLVIGFSPGKPCLPSVRIAREADGSEVPSGSMKIKMLSSISNERGHLRVVRQSGRKVADCFYALKD